MSFGSIETRIAFSVQQNPGVFALMIGSGVSRAAAIPTGWEITLDLVRSVAEADGVPTQADWGKWYVDTFGKSPDYSELLERLGSTEALRRQKLESYIEPNADERDDGLKTPTAAHHSIARLVKAGYVKVIITTNFDRLLENALREIGIEPTIVSSVDALKGAEPFTHARCYILKIHGDYKDTRILNTDLELRSYPNEFNILLDRIFDEFGLIVCGWSGEWDHALRAAILRSPNRRYPWFWASRGAIGPRGKEILDHRKGELVSIADADSFFTKLSSQVDALAIAGNRSPDEIGVLIARTKKYLSKPEFLIDFSDLVYSQSDKIIKRLQSDDMAPNCSMPGDELARRFAVFAAIGEGFNRVCALTGAWGGDQHLEVLGKAIKAIWIETRPSASGYQEALAIRGCSAVLAAQATCLGFLQYGRFSELRTFLRTSTLNRENRADADFLEDLMPVRWEGNDQRIWRRLSGRERRHTPFDDLVHELLVERGLPDLTPRSEISENYMLLQALVAFMCAEVYGEEKLKSELADIGTGRSSVKMRVYGRIGWDKWALKHLVEKIETNSFTRSLSDAGFFFGKQEMCSVFTRHLLDSVDQLHW
jgi:hypothetical protein